MFISGSPKRVHSKRLVFDKRLASVWRAIAKTRTILTNVWRTDDERVASACRKLPVTKLPVWGFPSLCAFFRSWIFGVRKPWESVKHGCSLKLLPRQTLRWNSPEPPDLMKQPTHWNKAPSLLGGPCDLHMWLLPDLAPPPFCMLRFQGKSLARFLSAGSM